MDNPVKVVHKIEDDVELKNCENPGFLLCNKIGGFMSFSSVQNISKFQGCYFLRPINELNWTLFKIIEDIRLIGKTPTHLINNFYNIERWYGSTNETFYMFKDAFVYNVENNDDKGNNFCEIEITLDCRDIYDFDDKGRIYRIYKDKDFVIVEYKKYKNNDLKDENYKIYLVIKGCDTYRLIDRWEPKEYVYDNYRGSQPKEIYVYKALKIPVNNKITKSLIFSYGDNLDKAKETAYNLDINYKKYLLKSREYVKTICKMPYEDILHDEKIKVAYKCCIRQMDLLSVNFKNPDIVNTNSKTTVNFNNYGLFAGLPWFFHLWTRDEAISSIAFIKEESFLDAKKILFKQLSSLTSNGKIPNRLPASDLESADGVGWCFKRINDLMNLTKDKLQFNQYFSPNDVLYIKDKLRLSIVRHLKYSTVDNLAYNKRLETWMDTTVKAFKGDERAGFRIEIQALRLAMYKFMKELCKMTGDDIKSKEYSKLEQDVRLIVKNRFWKSPVLIDGIDESGNNDDTIRPNIFIAYYVYHDLLSIEEWKTCFDHAIKKLWLKWGGFSTIDKNHKLFCDAYTGEDNKSYHRGDSWYWLNCLAAVCMHRLNNQIIIKKNKTTDENNKSKRIYDPYIKKIIDACSEEILFKGFIGHHAELSSAKELRGEGCLSQTWSAAMFIELVDTIYFKI
ncbi:MAG: amylo-alpha-1,6-glucosidase [Candidatus Woesearchaeota archaeon]